MPNKSYMVLRNEGITISPIDISGAPISVKEIVGVDQLGNIVSPSLPGMDVHFRVTIGLLEIKLLVREDNIKIETCDLIISSGQPSSPQHYISGKLIDMKLAEDDKALIMEAVAIYGRVMAR